MKSKSFRLYIATLLVLTASAVQPPAEARSTEKLSRISIDNFGQVDDNYYRGAQPKGHDYADLAALGVKTVIDLTANGEANEEKLVESQGMKFFRIPLTTSARPPVAAVERFLQLVNDPENLPVYVHCQGGRHRTGVMTAVYRITRDGWTADRAFSEMKQYQFEKGFVSHNALKNFVFDYYTQAAAAAAQPAVAAGRQRQ